MAFQSQSLGLTNFGFFVADLHTQASRDLAEVEMPGGVEAADLMGLRFACQSTPMDELRAIYLRQGGSDERWDKALAKSPCAGAISVVVTTGAILAVAWVLFTPLARGGSA